MSTAWETYLAEHQPRFLEELLSFLRIPSISALPDHAEAVRQAAEWVAERMGVAGIEGVRIMPTAGHPVVYGEWLHAPGKPTVMIYGHFDVQPVDPLALWSSPPFEPTVRDGRIYARGASDDKGNMLVPILAVEALLKSAGALPFNMKFIFEGQEEIGSPQIPAFVAANRELLACDLVLSADGGQWSETEPAILLGLRGGCAVQIDVRGANSDLHSGIYGGTIQNPTHALVRLLDTMRAADGTITVDGFYNGISLTDEERARIAEVPFDEEVYLDELGVMRPSASQAIAPESAPGRDRRWRSSGSGAASRARASRPCCRTRPTPRSPAAWWQARTPGRSCACSKRTSSSTPRRASASRWSRCRSWPSPT